MSTKCPRNNEYTHSHQNGSICAKQGGQGRGGFEPVSGTDIKPNEWADLVFAPGYMLRQLGEISSYMTDNQFLTGGCSLDSGNGAGGHGCDRTEAKLLEKVEELTLYLIARQKELVTLRQQVKRLTAIKR